MICPECQTSNPDEARFCQNCGKALANTCPDCGTAVAPGAKYCHNCGRSLSPASRDRDDLFSRYLPREYAAKLQAARLSRAVEGERRVVTILFCDVKGSTAMAEGLDPEEWTEIMNQAFEYLIQPVYRYEGTVARLMGDAILAFFGAPIAHEDDPQRAVLAGLGIVQGISAFRELLQRERQLEFNVRVGINTGLVVVGEVGSDLRVEYTAMGDAVNLAARMEQTAEPGTVQISASSYKLVAPFFEFEPLGGIQVKGKTEAVLAYRLIARRKEAAPARGIEGLHSSLVGRERELSRLKTCCDELLQGRGQIVSVIGEAGLGKSRLVAELRQIVRDQPVSFPASSGLQDTYSPGVSWYEGRCLSYETSTPYIPFTGLFGKIFNLGVDQSPEQWYGEIQAKVRGLFPQNGSEIAPFIATLLGVQPPGEDFEYVRYLEPPLLRERIFEAVSRFIERLSEKTPCVLVFEDIHWIDATSLDLLERLLPITHRASLIVLALFRPRRQEPSWHLHELAEREHALHYTSILLEPLDEGSARLLVANLLHIEDLPEKVRALILKKADGNPFFVEEVIRSLLDQKLVVRDDLQPSHWRATREIEDISVPDTLTGVITARLDRLDEDSKRVLQTAAVIGREFAHEALADVYGVGQGLHEALANLQQRELIREKAMGAYLFKHALTQETAYHSLLMSKRRELHRRFAGYLERTDPERANDIARHYIDARQEERALPYLVRAGGLAARAYSAPEAMAHFRQAIEILSKMAYSELARSAYEGLGRVLSFSNEAQGAADNYQAMLRYAQQYADFPMQVSALNKMGDVVALQLGQFHEAETTLADAERLARLHNDLPGLAEHYMIRCGMCTATANFDGAVKYLSEAVQIGRDLNLKEQLALGLAHIANTMTFMTRFDEAWETAQEGLRVSEEIGHREHKAEILVGPVAQYQMRNGELEAARLAAQEGVNIATQIGSLYGQCVGEWVLGEIARMRGEYEDAIRHYELGVQAGEPMEPFMPMFLINALSGLGSTYMEISDQFRQQVEEIHSRALKLLEHPAGGMAGSVAWTELGFCVMATGKFDAAQEFFHKGLTIPTPQMLLQRPRLLYGSARVALAQGNIREADEQARQARASIEASNMKHYMPVVGLAEALVLAEQGHLGAAVERLAEVERLARGMGMRPLVLEAQAEAGRALARLGRSAEARGKLEQARATLGEIADLFQDEGLREAYVRHAGEKLDIDA